MSASSACVLAVDDNATIRRAIAMRLSSKGYQVVTAEDGIQALAALERQSFDLVLLDLQMPGMDGISATYEIRRIEIEEALKTTPIVAMTAHVLDEDRTMAHKAGMQDFLIKPVSADEFQRVLTRFL